MKKVIRKLVEKCNRKLESIKFITAEVQAIGANYNLFYDLPVFNSRQLFDGRVMLEDDFLLDNFSLGASPPQQFIYLSYDGTMYFVDTQGYGYMRYIAKIVK